MATNFQAWRAHLRSREVEVTVTHKEWDAIWEASGKWKLRGTSPQDYCMVRKDRSKPASRDNLRVVQLQTLHKEYAGDRQQLFDALAEVGYGAKRVVNLIALRKKKQRRREQ